MGPNRTRDPGTCSQTRYRLHSWSGKIYVVGTLMNWLNFTLKMFAYLDLCHKLALKLHEAGFISIILVNTHLVSMVLQA